MNEKRSSFTPTLFVPLPPAVIPQLRGHSFKQDIVDTKALVERAHFV